MLITQNSLLDGIIEIQMTENEAARLHACEAVIEHGLKTFVDVGNALLEIRDSRLYRQEYETFEDYCRERWGMSRIHAFRMIEAAGVTNNLLPIGNILPANEAQARPLTTLPPDLQVRAWKQAIETAPDGKITGAHVQSVVDEIVNKPHVAFNSGNNEWYTPAPFAEAARRVMGAIDLDPASSEIANKTIGAKIYLTAEDDGLRFSWDGRVWMNPPYSSDLVGKFTEKLAQHFIAGEITEAIVLVNNATETIWFQGLLEAASAVCFPKGRVKFIDMDGNPSGAPLQGQAIVYFGCNTEAFATEFKEFGKILYG